MSSIENNELSIRKVVSSEWQGVRNKNEVAKSKNQTARSELLIAAAKHQEGAESSWLKTANSGRAINMQQLTSDENQKR